MARPKKPIDEIQLRKLARMQCTLEEIAAWFDVNISTISRRYAKEIAQAKLVGKTSLRRYQWKRAHAGSDAMLIHMGKHILGQTDRRQDDDIEILEALSDGDSSIPSGERQGPATGPA